MATLAEQVEELKGVRAKVTTLNNTITKLRKESNDWFNTLKDRIAALEKIIADGSADQATIDAVIAEVTGLKDDMAAAKTALDEFDADVPDAESQG